MGDPFSLITVFPECPFSFFPLVEFLSGSTGDKFDGIGYCLAVRIICYKQMNVIGCDRIIENYQAISLPGFIKPRQPSAPVFGELKQEFPFMAAVPNVPNLPGDIVSFCSCHGYNAVFGPKKCNIGLFSGLIFKLSTIFTER